MSSVNRRTFLASAGAGAAALASVSKAKAADANDRIQVAVIGVHGRGMSHVEAFSKNPQTRVATICDVDASQFEHARKRIEEKTGETPTFVQDLRKVMEDKSIDVVSIATPNHWHALAAVWACQAGKDVYVEKPVSHNVVEGKRIVEAARKYKRIVQTGTQNRSSSGVKEAVDFLHSGKLGTIYLARALCFKPRGSIGVKADAPVPKGFDYNIWLGPAPERPFNPNRFHYEWHWNWDYGNGDIGNQGIHQMDVARWGLGKSDWPALIESSGGRYAYKDDGQTPNTQSATFRYDDCLLEFEVRGLPTNDEMGIKVGNLFYGSEGCLAINGGTWKTFLGHKNTPGPSGKGGDSEGGHFENFVKAVVARDPSILNADIIEGHRSSALCHLANISYRLKRAINFDSKTETFGSDHEANAMLSREYRSPFVMPDVV